MIVSVDQLVDYMSNVTLTADQRTAAEEVIAGVQDEIETYLNRPIEVRALTETLRPDAFGILYPRYTPVVAVTSIADADAATLAADTYTIDGNLIRLNARYAGPLTVTYTGGLDGPNVRALRLAVLRIASREMQNRHDTTRSVKGLVSEDVAPLPEGLQEEDKERLERHRRRVAR